MDEAHASALEALRHEHEDILATTAATTSAAANEVKRQADEAATAVDEAHASALEAIGKSTPMSYLPRQQPPPPLPATDYHAALCLLEGRSCGFGGTTR